MSSRLDEASLFQTALYGINELWRKGHQHQHSRTSDVDISTRHDVTSTVTPDVKVLYKSHWLDSQLADFLVNFGFWSSCEVFPQYFFVLTTGIECRESRTSLREEEGTADCCGDCRHLRYQDNHLSTLHKKLLCDAWCIYDGETALCVIRIEWNMGGWEILHKMLNWI